MSDLSVVNLRLPVPPSVNGAFCNISGAGRSRTAAYRAWANEAGWVLLAQKPPHLGTASTSIAIVVNLPPGRRGDIDNRIKCCLDLLVAHRVIDDDRYVNKVSAEWSDSVAECEVTIRSIAGTATIGMAA